MKNELRGIGKPQPLTDAQVVKLSEFHELTLSYGKRLLELLPNVAEREKAIDALRELQLRGEAAIRVGRSVLTPGILADLFGPIQARDVLVSRLWINAHEWADLLKTGRDVVDQVAQRAVLQAGIYGHIWTTEIRCSRKIPQGHVYMTASDEGDADLAPDWVPDASKFVKL